MADSNSSGTSSSSAMGIATVVAGLLIVAGFLTWRMIPRIGPPPVPPNVITLVQLSPQEHREQLALRNQAIGHLENEDWFNALRVLKQIEVTLPNDLFTRRNMAVAMCGKKTFGGQDPHPISPEEAEAVAQRLLDTAPNDYVSQLLAARIAVGCRQENLAKERFRKATQLAPKNANAWFELYKSFGSGFSKQISPEALEAISQCYAAEPNNLIATLEFSKTLAAEKDPKLLEVLKSKIELIEQVRKFVQRPDLDPKKYYDQALKLLPDAIQSKDAKVWSAVSGQLHFMSNVLMAVDVYLADLSKLLPNPLDFVEFRFSDDSLNGDPEPAAPHPAIEVAFTQSVNQIELPTAPLRVQVADFDLDQRPDLYILSPGKLQIYGNAAQTNETSPAADPAGSKKVPTKMLPWRILAEIPVEAQLTGFTLADLDLDSVDVKPSGPVRPEPAGLETQSAPTKGSTGKPGDGTTICQQADSDLILYGPAGIQIWKNNVGSGGKRTYTRAEKTGLEAVRNVERVCAADFDLEGDLDLIVLLSHGLGLWSNREQFTFKDVSTDSVLPANLHVREIIPVDWDRDVDLDFVLLGEPLLIGEVTQKSTPQPTVCGVLRNQLHGRLKWEASLDGRAPTAVSQLAQAALVDADSNASWDLALASEQPQLIRTVTHSPGNVKLLDENALPGLLAGGVRSLDFDNDGSMDLLSWQGSVLQIVRGSSSGQFLDTVLKLPAVDSPIRDCHVVDLDSDGDLDVVVLTEKSVQILINDGGNKNHWLNVRLRARSIQVGAGTAGQSAKRVNHQGVGSLVELKTQGTYQPQVASGEVLHFGLGDRTKADLLRVLWTNGVPQGLINLEGNIEICEVQAPKGSCPFVYTWNGEHFEFCTDLLWNAPLGLQFAEGVVAQPRAWEYLKIPGERMTLKDDKYVLQVTEELWEATYFDQIELLAIDHPAEVEIYSNEKVGPPELAEFKIHTVHTPHLPVAASDTRGRDVLQQITKEDGDFTKTYDRKFRQGLTEEHWLELDLGKFEQPGPVTLFLTGWMYPTETSISVAVSQNPENTQAHPPALWAPDAQGKWKEIRPFMGFPGGKTKTIAIDLAGVFAGDDHRLRIVTNMEFYWDHAFFTVGETPVPMTRTPLKMTAADLHVRGVSQHYWRPGNGPDQYDYQHVISTPMWPPMQGNFTRLGDVLELLTQQDDRLAVIGAGDEITVTFATPDQSLPAGWKRDFIMHNVGWDKDADLHTLYGQTVEPLPFNAMSGYPFRADEAPVDSEEYRRYLQQYQTRQQPYSQFWRGAK
jgi:tetratricopeptide (TPR) repeat protein